MRSGFTLLGRSLPDRSQGEYPGVLMVYIHVDRFSPAGQVASPRGRFAQAPLRGGGGVTSGIANLTDRSPQTVAAAQAEDAPTPKKKENFFKRLFS